MRSQFAVALILTILGSSFYLYHEVQAVCYAPLSYRIGFIDNRFDLSQGEARVAIADAESVWEQATGKNVFTYDPEGDLVINFVYDERQEFAEAEEVFRERLDASEDVNSAIGETYEALSARYDALEVEYENKVASYEDRLDAYNQKVAGYNQNGGAPAEAFQEFEKERDMIDSELHSVNDLGNRLNDLVNRINSVSEQGNELISQYNDKINTYNEAFGGSREFTQGDYQAGVINIYKFTDETELKLVLAHELGHAVSLGHVEGEASIMFDYLGEQPDPLRLSEPDLTEYERVCGETTRSFIERLLIRFGL